MSESEFVLDFVEEGSLTPIDIVIDVTGLTYEEVKSCSDILVIDSEPCDICGGTKLHSFNCEKIKK